MEWDPELGQRICPRPAPCTGRGECLTQRKPAGRGAYSALHRHRDVACEFGCRPVSCPNSEICGETDLPQWLLDCRGGLCLHCDMLFGNWQSQHRTVVPQRRSLTNGRLVFTDRMEALCPICLEEECVRGVRMPMCPNHFVCVECFRTAWFPWLGTGHDGDGGDDPSDGGEDDTDGGDGDSDGGESDRLYDTRDNPMRSCPLCRRDAEL